MKRDYRRGLSYHAGGNPPVNAGMFLDGERIAWWPAGYRLPDQRAASLILAAYEAKGSVLDHTDVRDALRGVEPEEPMVVDHTFEGDGVFPETWCYCGRSASAHARRPR